MFIFDPLWISSDHPAFGSGCAKSPGAVTTEAYVPLYYAPGEADQFHWSHEIIFASKGLSWHARLTNAVARTP